MLYSLLLAGGKSSRMGQDKAALEYDGATLLQHALNLLRDTGADQILVSGKFAEVAGCVVLPDIMSGCGPLGGLHAALHYIDRQGDIGNAMLLVIPVDMPRLDKNVLSPLLVSMNSAASCHYAGEIFPCVFHASRALLVHLDALLAESTELGGKRSMHALLSFAQEVILPVGGLPADTFLNLNRPEDWRAFLESRNR